MIYFRDLSLRVKHELMLMVDFRRRTTTKWYQAVEVIRTPAGVAEVVVAMAVVMEAALEEVQEAEEVVQVAATILIWPPSSMR